MDWSKSYEVTHREFIFMVTYAVVSGLWVASSVLIIRESYIRYSYKYILIYISFCRSHPVLCHHQTDLWCHLLALVPVRAGWLHSGRGGHCLPCPGHNQNFGKLK